jgi:AraC-like DNA-binding protein
MGAMDSRYDRSRWGKCILIPMNPVRNWRELSEQPVGHYLARPNLVAWCPTPDLVGITLCDAQTAEDLAALFSFFDGLGDQVAAEFDLIFDARHAKEGDIDAMDIFIKGLESRGGALSPRVRRQVYVRPGGVCGAALTGILNLMPSIRAWHVVTSTEEVASWLERPEVLQHSEVVETMTGEINTAGPVVARLRMLLRTTGLRLSVQDAGRALAMAPRSLQRHLKAANTSFREEIERARLDMARRLLGESTLKLETIGHRIGFRSAAHFTVFFGKRAGITPSAWRRQFNERRAVAS